MKALPRHSPRWPWPGGVHRRLLRGLSVLFALAVTVAACSTVTDEAAAPTRGGGPLDLASVCPNPIAFQTTWHPQAEQLPLFQVLGEGYTPDGERKAVRGPLVAHDADSGQPVPTGVDIEIRAGGPAIGFQPVTALLYQDETLTLGMVPADEAIQFAKDQPVTGVLAPFEIDPQVILFSPEVHPEWNTLVDIGQSNATVVFAESTGTYMRFLVGSGILKESQLDSSYEGGPARFVAEQGEIATQGFATNEPYTWEHEIPEWGRPLEYVSVADAGYPNYRNMIVVRSGDLETLTQCLERLVPILQQGIVDFMDDPTPAITRILDIIETSAPDYFDSFDRSRHAVDVMIEDQLISNGDDDTIGNFDPDRVQQLMDIVLPIYEGQNIEVAEGLSVEDVATNQFIDESTSLAVVAASPSPTPKADQP